MDTRTEQQRLQRILKGQHEFMDQVHEVLAEEQKRDDVLRAVVLSSKKERVAKFDQLDGSRVFQISTIEAMCIRYRLRFLDAGLFKGELPLQAIHAVRNLERSSSGPLLSFKIMAPADRFRLCDSDVDPLLFVPLGNDKFYLVHKWGTDLAWHRVLRGWPVRRPIHLAATVLLLAAFLSIVFPDELLAAWGVQRSFLFIWTSMVFASFTVFGWFAFFGQFSSEAWNSRYFN